jgi:hypothetical protein
MGKEIGIVAYNLDDKYIVGIENRREPTGSGHIWVYFRDACIIQKSGLPRGKKNLADELRSIYTKPSAEKRQDLRYSLSQFASPIPIRFQIETPE